MTTVLRNASIFDGTGAPPADGDIAISDGRIAAVGPDLDGDDAIDLEGKAVLPGLFDCHVHVMFGSVSVWQLLQEPFSLAFYEAARNLKATLDAGITTVRDAGGADLGVKTAVERGLIPGPRMQISLNMISQTGGHGDGWWPSGQAVRLLGPSPGRPSGIVDGPEEMRKKVRELVRAGADVIKVATSGGVVSPRDDPAHAHFQLDELEMLVAEAAAAGISAMAHAQAADGIKNAVRAGIRSIEHGIYLDEEAIELMLERGTYLVATLVAPQGVIDAAEAGAPIPDVTVAKARDVVEAHRDSFRRAVDAGVRIATGTDAAVIPHGTNLRELGLMADGGMQPEAVLEATTRVAAELMDLDEALGTIEPGKIADLTIVTGDPLDVATLGDRVAAVIKSGELVSGTL